MYLENDSTSRHGYLILDSHSGSEWGALMCVEGNQTSFLGRVLVEGLSGRMRGICNKLYQYVPARDKIDEKSFYCVMVVHVCCSIEQGIMAIDSNP